MVGGLPLDAWLNGLWLPFLRISGALLAAPLFSATQAPPPVRVMLAVLFSVLLIPLIPERPSLSPLGVEGLLRGGNELLIGLAIGFLLQLVFEAVMFGGQLIATSMGLSFSTLVDPQTGSAVPVLSQFLNLLALLVFFALDGHLAYLQVIGDSFRQWPVGSMPFSAEAAGTVLAAFSEVLRGGVRLALAAMMSLLAVQVALGVISRSAPSLNLFSIGFPITLLLGLLVLWQGLPALVDTLERLLIAAWAQMDALLALGGRHGG